MFFPSKKDDTTYHHFYKTIILLASLFKTGETCLFTCPVTYLSSNCWMSEWLSDVHSITNDSGSVPAAVDSNLANPAFPKIHRLSR